MREEISDCLKVVLDAITMGMSGMYPLRLWQIDFRYLALYVPVRTSSQCLYLHLVWEEGVAGDFAVAGDGENKKKGGEIRCHLEEVSVEVGLVVGEVVVAEALAGVLAEVGAEAGLVGVILMLGAGRGMECLMDIPTEDTDLATLTMAQSIPMVGTHGKNVC